MILGAIEASMGIRKPVDAERVAAYRARCPECTPLPILPSPYASARLRSVARTMRSMAVPADALDALRALAAQLTISGQRRVVMGEAVTAAIRYAAAAPPGALAAHLATSQEQARTGPDGSKSQ
jgi:hypothetical protein